MFAPIWCDQRLGCQGPASMQPVFPSVSLALVVAVLPMGFKWNDELTQLPALNIAFEAISG